MERSLVAGLMLVLGCSSRGTPGDATAPEERDAASDGSPDLAVDVASDGWMAVADSAVGEAPDAPPGSRLARWNEAKFGMFIHWGLYAVPAGQWHGQRVGGSAEWIMNNAQIPVKEYAALADTFNPVQFDAEAWVRIARNAGMKYIVFTAKHHEGFAMYPSPGAARSIADRAGGRAGRGRGDPGAVNQIRRRPGTRLNDHPRVSRDVSSGCRIEHGLMSRIGVPSGAHEEGARLEAGVHFLATPPGHALN